jgi:hypothetical protein
LVNHRLRKPVEQDSISKIMKNLDPMTKNGFLYPRSRYYGAFSPETLAFNANLQEFAQKISISLP